MLGFTKKDLEVMTRVEDLMRADEMLHEVEDEYLETWLMMGPPDGMDLAETIEELSDIDTYIEWLNLADRLLERRKD